MRRKEPVRGFIVEGRGGGLFQILVYPWKEVRHSRVHAGILTLAASDSPANDSHLRPSTVVHHQRPAAVTLQFTVNLYNLQYILYIPILQSRINIIYFRGCF